MTNTEPDRIASQLNYPAPGQPGKAAVDRIDGSPLAPIADENATLGNALRTIYQQTVEERVPDEMLDLLKRLS
ncbi:NepR family anti-sigma factor [Sphingobium fluviale]|uniref:Anti-sigma factor NepR domain-containing protein n=1 Tax=Sphingobium fluviale TaxID=2506423 RepID=A0A4Q1KJ63_9SPHN|nr:NepR family anti-sigma factor [Sphingobium fluviale]RXR29853.1 hypothetical protein EQG66_04730 [Sphingobium fluviale]